MRTLMNVVPVWVGYQYGGLAEVEGMLRDEGDHLVLEYQSKEALVGGMLKSIVRQACIPRDILSSVTLQKTLLGLKTKLVIQTTRLEPVADVPGASQGRLVLQVAKRDRPAAEKLVADLRLPDPASVKPAQFDTGLE
jgi:hypothetical protein